MDTLIGQKATIIKAIPSAIMPSWVVAYAVRYDKAPPMEYNMANIECMQFSKWIERLNK